MNNNRVETLDYLRGIMAFSVLIYHFTTWSNLNFIYPFDNLVDRLGIYAVSAFYVLSGTSLAIGYAKKELNTKFLRVFAVKRIFRIAPLFYLATTLTIIVLILSAYKDGDFSNIPTPEKLSLNYSMLFGWLSPTNYIATGAWSIGNELVFYSIFPIMLYLINKSTKYFIGFFVFSILLSGYFSEVILNTETGIVDQWGVYINPLNLLYFFVGGVLIGLLLKSNFALNKKWVMTLLVISVGSFIFMPVSGTDHIVLVKGYPKLILSLAIFALVLVAVLSVNIKHNIMTKVLKYLGDTSYSIYLLHPIVFAVFSTILSSIPILDNEVSIFLFSIIGSLIVAHISYNFVEIPFMKLGKKYTVKIPSKIKLRWLLKLKNITKSALFTK